MYTHFILNDNRISIQITHVRNIYTNNLKIITVKPRIIDTTHKQGLLSFLLNKSSLYFKLIVWAGITKFGEYLYFYK